MKTIIEDKREITCISSDGEYGVAYSIQDSFYQLCDKIIPYEELGVGSMITWLAVYDDDKIICRVPSWQVRIFYEQEET
jgi:hypothetical protein